ncbi:hypothetical protein [Arcanobacterium pinnipediorum]|uniref:Uncharacterized protein n=1 Tax=Arcanobacterium pinnipediorum TaxID=1503041 RepID=A0ABY5AJS1_9ACTO|nr:hypothetical protein [Arcanobacterium pinnipediorum]USR80100.1 hypothetical protein NG665_03765 [Arcanobacterium pinnipediorum]
MNIVLVATALPGCEPDAVANAAISGWGKARPADNISIIMASDGELVAHVGTGLSRVFQHDHIDAQAIEYLDNDGPRRILWTSRTDRRGLIDLAEAATWEGVSDPRGSSRFLAQDIFRALDMGLDELHIHLPAFMSGSDIGRGLLEGLSGVELEWDSDKLRLREAVDQARRAIGSLRLVVSYSYGLELSGFDGLAHAWQKAGLDPSIAQRFHNDVAQYVHHLQRLRAQWDLTATTHGIHRYDVDGVGGGLGLVFSLLRAQLHLVGQNLVFPHETADLYVYVTNSVGLHIPSGVSAMSQQAEHSGSPAILVVCQSQLLRAELARLGLHGMYRLEATRDDLVLYHDDIANLFTRLATTWGWDV